MIIIFTSQPVYDEKYIKVKLKEFNGVLNTNFLGCEVQWGGVHYTCKACISIDSVMKMERKNYPLVYLEECKYKVKKKKMPEFMNAELNSNSDFDSERL